MVELNDDVAGMEQDGIADVVRGRRDLGTDAAVGYLFAVLGVQGWAGEESGRGASFGGIEGTEKAGAVSVEGKGVDWSR